MPTLKKLKYDFGDGSETVVTIKMNSKGEISADIPMHVHAVTGVFARGKTLDEVEKLCLKAWCDFVNATKTTERVILIDLKWSNPPFMNEGMGMHLNFLVAEKEMYGQKTKYRLVQKEMFGQGWRVMSNEVPTHHWTSIHNQGVTAEKSLEIPFTEEAYAKIADIEKRLRELYEMLEKICGSREGIMALVEGKLNLLLGQKTV